MTAYVPKSIRKRSDLVADQIKEAIISKKLPPGERLSDEKDFLKTYRVSKGTMREALKSLEVQGLVKIKTGPGGGASVARVSAEKTNELLWNYFFSRNVSLEDIYAVRKLVEPELAASVAEHLDEEDLQLLEQSVGHCSLKGFEDNNRAQRIQENEKRGTEQRRRVHDADEHAAPIEVILARKLLPMPSRKGVDVLRDVHEAQY